MSDEEEKIALDLKDLYDILLDTRNMEIKLFWERSNYFLVLNSGLAVGYFNIGDKVGQGVFAFIGLISAVLWVGVCLGGRFWQAKWEGTLSRFESKRLDGVCFFSSTKDENISDARVGLDYDGQRWPIKKFFYWLVLKKPSVSYAMILLSVIFFVGWTVLFFHFFWQSGLSNLFCDLFCGKG